MGNPKRLPTRVRSPLLEGLAVLGQDALIISRRGLTVSEEKVLRGIFKDSLDYHAIQIAATNVTMLPRVGVFCPM